MVQSKHRNLYLGRTKASAKTRSSSRAGKKNPSDEDKKRRVVALFFYFASGIFPWESFTNYSGTLIKGRNIEPNSGSL